MGGQQDKADRPGAPLGGTRPGPGGPAPRQRPAGAHAGTNSGRPDAAAAAPATAGSGPSMRPPGVVRPGKAAQPQKPSSNDERAAKRPRAEPAAAGKGPAAQGAGQQLAGPAGAGAGRGAPDGRGSGGHQGSGAANNDVEQELRVNAHTARGHASLRDVPASSFISDESEIPEFLRGRAAFGAGGQSSDVTLEGLESLLGPQWRELRGAGREDKGGGAGMRTRGTQGGDEACSGGLDGTIRNGCGSEGGDGGRGGGGGYDPGRGSGGDGGGGGGDYHISGRHRGGSEAPTAEQGRPSASAAPPAAPAPGPTATIRQGRPDTPPAAGPPKGRGGLPNGGASGSGELARVKGGSCRVPAFLRKRWAVSALAEGATEEKTVYCRRADGSVVPYIVQLGSGGRLTGLADLVMAVGANDNHMLRMTWEMVQAANGGAAGGQFGVVVEDAGPAAAAATGEGPAEAAAGTAAGAGAGGVEAAAATRPKAGGGELRQRQADGGGGGPKPDWPAGTGAAEPRREVEREAGQQQAAGQQQREQQGAAAPR